VGNLKRLKEATISWAQEKNSKEEQELRHIELSLLEIREGVGKGYLTHGEKENPVSLEKRRKCLLEEKEDLWILKSRAI